MDFGTEGSLVIQLLASIVVEYPVEILLSFGLEGLLRLSIVSGIGVEGKLVLNERGIGYHQVLNQVEGGLLASVFCVFIAVDLEAREGTDHTHDFLVKVERVVFLAVGTVAFGFVVSAFFVAVNHSAKDEYRNTDDNLHIIIFKKN